MRIGLRTTLRPGAAERYDALHRDVPESVVDAIRAAGFTEWHIFRDGDDLFHCIEVDDYDSAIAVLAEVPANVAWQATVAPLMTIAHDHSGAGRDRLEVIWDLSW